MNRYYMYIGGEFVEPEGGNYLKSVNPTTGEIWAEIPSGSMEDVNRAVEAADRCFRSKEWKAISHTKRGRLLRKLADTLATKASYLAEVESRDNGKLYKEMLAQANMLPAWFEYYAGLADKIEGSVIPLDRQSVLNYTLREPLGVIGMITPWNSPLLLTAFKLGPALAAGNTVVIKPSEYTSASTLEFARIFNEIGFPPGTINVVTGDGVVVGDTLTKHPKVRKIAFTGGTETGRKVGQNASLHFASVTLELGGKSPNIVFADANLDAAVAGVIAGIYAAGGQTCVAGSRLFVEASILESFVDLLVKRTEQIILGDPFDPLTQMGPVANVNQLEKIDYYVSVAREEGAKLLTGGERYKHEKYPKGLFYRPTILSNVNNKMRIAQEEVFGPVLAVIPFSSEEEAIQMANDSQFGLGAGVWTNDVKKAHRMARGLEAGTVWINTYRALTFNSPFGGYKSSGLGRENGKEAIYEYTQIKSVWVELSDEIQDPFAIKL